MCKTLKNLLLSKIENGIRKPSIKLFQKIADAMDMMIIIELVPKSRRVSV